MTAPNADELATSLKQAQQDRADAEEAFRDFKRLEDLWKPYGSRDNEEFSGQFRRYEAKLKELLEKVLDARGKVRDLEARVRAEQVMNGTATSEEPRFGLREMPVPIGIDLVDTPGALDPVEATFDPSAATDTETLDKLARDKLMFGEPTEIEGPPPATDAGTPARAEPSEAELETLRQLERAVSTAKQELDDFRDLGVIDQDDDWRVQDRLDGLDEEIGFAKLRLERYRKSLGLPSTDVAAAVTDATTNASAAPRFLDPDQDDPATRQKQEIDKLMFDAPEEIPVSYEPPPPPPRKMQAIPEAPGDVEPERQAHPPHGRQAHPPHGLPKKTLLVAGIGVLVAVIGVTAAVARPPARDAVPLEPVATQAATAQPTAAAPAAAATAAGPTAAPIGATIAVTPHHSWGGSPRSDGTSCSGRETLETKQVANPPVGTSVAYEWNVTWPACASGRSWGIDFERPIFTPAYTMFRPKTTYAISPLERGTCSAGMCRQTMIVTVTNEGS